MMSDVLVELCCGVSPEAHWDGGAIYIACPKCGRRSGNIVVESRARGDFELNRTSAEGVAKKWNEEVTHG